MTEANINVKRETVCDWGVEINGERRGGVHKVRTSREIYFCHDLLIRRGARFSSLEKAVHDLVKRAAA